jgi:hypothetical protein
VSLDSLQVKEPLAHYFTFGFERNTDLHERENNNHKINIQIKNLHLYTYFELIGEKFGSFSLIRGTKLGSICSAKFPRG